MTQWSISGKYFETCNCEVACPCVFTSSPTEGECKALIAWHIDKGHYGDVKLDGLNVALAVHAPGNMVQTKWRVAAYFDDKANEAQNGALHVIFGGKAGGHPEMLASFIGELVGAKNVPMHYEADGKHASLTIPGITGAAIEAMEGQGGAGITIDNHPLCVAPGEPATVAKSKSFTFADVGMEWKFSDRNGFLSNFAYSA